MSFKVLIFRDESGGCWSKVPAFPGCATQGETIEELMTNSRAAILGWLSIDTDSSNPAEHVETDL